MDSPLDETVHKGGQERFETLYQENKHLRELLRRCHKAIQFAKRSTIGSKGRTMLDEMDVELAKELAHD